MRRLLSCLVLSTLFVAAGCGDDDDGGAVEDASSSASVESEPAEEIDPAAAQADVDGAIAAFVAALEAEGFVLEPEDPEDASDGEGGGDDALSFDTPECEAFEEAFPEDEEDDLPGSIAEAESGSYARMEESALEGGAFAEGMVAVMGESAEVDELFELLEGDEFASCIEEAFRTGFEESMAEEDGPAMDLTLDVETVDPASDVDDGVAIEFEGSMGFLGMSFDLGGSVHLVRRDERAAMLLLFGFGSAPDLDEGALLDLLLG
jgi:hypothetical protein